MGFWLKLRHFATELDVSIFNKLEAEDRKEWEGCKEDSLQQKIIQLESKLENPKYALSEPSQPLKSSKTIHESRLKTESSLQSPYLTSNDPKSSALLSEVRNTTSQTKDIQSKSLLEASKINFKTSDTSQQYDLPSDQSKPQNQPNFITLSQIPDQEKIEIIKLGFQLQARGTISLKKYYETTDPNSLFQFKGYFIKYETIRRTKLYQTLKE